jgi:DNA-binding PadR family transcriptional regulator
MPRRPDRSAQTLAVLDAMVAEPADWHYGYDLARRTGLRSGTLYPILARLADRGHLERRWEDEPPPGRPARHLYRLSVQGLALAREQAPAELLPVVVGTVRQGPAATRRLAPQ